MNHKKNGMLLFEKNATTQLMPEAWARI